MAFQHVWSVLEAGIRDGAFPGAVAAVADEERVLASRHFGHASSQGLRIGQFLFVDAGAVAFRSRRSAEGAASTDHDHLIAEHGGENGEHRHFLTAGDLSPRGKGGANFVLHFELWKDAEFELPVVEKGFHLT